MFGFFVCYGFGHIFSLPQAGVLRLRLGSGVSEQPFHVINLVPLLLQLLLQLLQLSH